MKKTYMILSVVLVLGSTTLFGAASDGATSDTVAFNPGKLTILNKGTFDTERYACVVSHWPEISMPGLPQFQQPGFVAALMKKEKSNNSEITDPLVMCRSLAIALQYNANNNMAFYISNPRSVLIQTMQNIDKAYAEARMAAGYPDTAAIKAVAILFGESYRNDQGVLSSTIIEACGVKEDDQANYLPGFTEIVELDPSSMPYALRLPESEDTQDAPVVLWSAQQ
jgi:hypothetical protein